MRPSGGSQSACSSCADPIARMAGGARIDRRTAVDVVLRDIRRAAVAHGSRRRSRPCPGFLSAPTVLPGNIVLDHVERGGALGRALASVSRASTMRPLLGSPSSGPHVTELGLLAGSVAEQPHVRFRFEECVSFHCVSSHCFSRFHCFRHCCCGRRRLSYHPLGKKLLQLQMVSLIHCRSIVFLFGIPWRRAGTGRGDDRPVLFPFPPVLSPVPPVLASAAFLPSAQGLASELASNFPHVIACILFWPCCGVQ